MVAYNPILAADGYKIPHWLMTPPGMQRSTAYIESRGGRWPQTLFFGPQIHIKDHLTKRVTEDNLREAIDLAGPYGVPQINVGGWRSIIDEFDGRLPLSIKAIPEGTVLPTGNVMMTIDATDERFGWLPGYLETQNLRSAWYPTTVATTSFFIKRLIKPFLDLTSDDPETEIWSRLHDFGARAVSGDQQAEIGGAAHLINFTGTDTLEGIRAAKHYYGAINPGQSIPAAEHSTITSWGKLREVDAYRHMVQTFGVPGAAYSVVSDSYDLQEAVWNLWGSELRQEVIDSGAILVVRPDSGDPVLTSLRVIDMLSARYGFSINSKGYKVLNSVRVIQGDGIGYDEVGDILTKLVELGFSASNIVFGMGGKLLQSGIDRDTQKFAQKTSAVEIDGEWHEVFKQPAGDLTKRSKGGRLALIRDESGYKTVPLDGNEERNELVEVFRDGEITRDWTFQEIRDRAASAL